MNRSLRSLVAALALAGSALAQCELDKIVTTSGTGTGSFGAVGVSSSTLVVGAGTRSPAGGTSLSGAALVFQRSGSTFTETQELAGSDSGTNDWFGTSVDFDGTTIVIGAFFHRHAFTVFASYGGAYVYEWDGTSWVEVAEGFQFDTTGQQGYATEVAVDGTTIMVGATSDDVGRYDEGSVYAYDRLAAGWTYAQKLVASDGVTGAEFGFALDIEGTRVAVGAPGTDVLIGDEGAVYVFDRVGGQWTESSKLFASNGAPNDDFGAALALDGERLLVGAPQAAAPCGGPPTPYVGRAYVFERDPTSGAWSEVAQLLAAACAPGSGFGTSVVLEGDRAIVGAKSGFGAVYGTGTAHVFERDPTSGAWSETARLFAADGAYGDMLGFDMALEGERLFAGALYALAAPGSTGAVYEFAVTPSGCPDFHGAPDSVSLASGGSQSLSLNPGVGEAGALYWVLGSVTGTTPGFVYGGASVPLNLDAYLVATVVNPPSTPLAASVGSIDAQGVASASFTLPPGSDPALAGLAVHHAYVTLDAGTYALRIASSAVRVDLVP